MELKPLDPNFNLFIVLYKPPLYPHRRCRGVLDRTRNESLEAMQGCQKRPIAIVAKEAVVVALEILTHYYGRVRLRLDIITTHIMTTHIRDGRAAHEEIGLVEEVECAAESEVMGPGEPAATPSKRSSFTSTTSMGDTQFLWSETETGLLIVASS